MGFIAVSSSATERGIAARQAARLQLISPPAPIRHDERRIITCMRFHDRRVRGIRDDRIRRKVYLEFFGTDQPKFKRRMQSIIHRICKATDTPEALVRGYGRHRELVRVRMACMYWCRRLTGQSYPTIGRWFDGRDHSTVMHNVRTYVDKRAKEGRTLRPVAGEIMPFPAIKFPNREGRA